MKFLSIFSIISIFAFPVFAESVSARVTDVYTNYRYVDEPVEIERCGYVEVPVYGYRHGGNAGDVIAGAIIGGAIGNQFGGESGQDAMTALGAVIGAESARNNGGRQEIIGYRDEYRCHYDTDYRNIAVVDGYVVHYRHGGHVGSIVTDRTYRVGDRIEIIYR